MQNYPYKFSSQIVLYFLGKTVFQLLSRSCILTSEQVGSRGHNFSLWPGTRNNASDTGTIWPLPLNDGNRTYCIVGDVFHHGDAALLGHVVGLRVQDPLLTRRLSLTIWITIYLNIKLTKCIFFRAGHATKLPRKCDYFFRPRNS